MQSSILGTRNVCLLTKIDLRKDIDYVLHLFACDIEIVDNTVLYFLTKSKDDESSISITLLTSGYNGSSKKIKLLTEKKNDLKTTDSLLEINPVEAPDVLENIKSRFYRKIKEEQWKLR